LCRWGRAPTINIASRSRFVPAKVVLEFVQAILKERLADIKV
jgi:hypothetical protein